MQGHTGLKAKSCSSGNQLLGWNVLPQWMTHLAIPGWALLPLMGLVVKLIVGVENGAQIDAADLVCGSFVLKVGLYPLYDLADTGLILQVVHILWQKEKGASSQHRLSK